MTLINANSGDVTVQEVHYMKICVDYNQVSDYEQLYCKNYGEKIYLCTWDYKIRLLIRKELMEKYNCLVGLSGIYFQKVDNNLWELVSENPYIIVLQE